MYLLNTLQKQVAEIKQRIYAVVNGKHWLIGEKTIAQARILDDEIDIKTLDVYQHIYSNYYGGGSSIYDRAVA